MSNPIFILGAPRSGTTFLASLLEMTEYGAPFETHFITKYYKALDLYGDLNDIKNFKRLITDILNERPVRQWDLSLDINAFFNELEKDIKYANIVNKLCLFAAFKDGNKNWGDKTPHYIGDIDIIYKLFPDSKYIYIVRDGRDVALSILRKPWGPNNIYTCAKYWQNLNKKSRDIEALKHNGQLYQLRYEDLLDNTDKYVAEIYSFLNESDYDEKLKTFNFKVKKGNYNKWKNALSAAQIVLFDKIAGNTLTRFGYEAQISEKKVNIFMQMAYILHHKILHYKYLFTLNIIDGIKIKYFGKEPFAE